MIESRELDSWLAQGDVQERLKPVREMQNVLLEMLKAIDGVCAKYGLRYYLHGGTLLGAVRHGGFIPWDDDADISMPRVDYEKFLEVAKSELATDYFVQDYRTEKYGRFVFAKLRKNGTAYKNEHHAHIKMHQGIFVDIFPLDELPQNRIKAWCLWNVPYFFERLTAFSSARLPKALKVMEPLQKIWQLLFSPSFFAMLSCKSAIRFSGKGDGSRWLVTHDPNRRNPISNSEPIVDYEPAMRMNFEGCELCVPGGYAHLLKHWYGDYMALPPIEKRLPIHGRGGVDDGCWFFHYVILIILEIS